MKYAIFGGYEEIPNLGSVLLAQGDYPTACTAYERALAIVEKVLGPDHPHTQTVRNNLASLDEEK